MADGYRYFEYSHDHKGPQDFGNNYAESLRRRGIDVEKLLPERDVQSVEVYRRGATTKGFGGLYAPTSDRDNVPPHLHQTYWCTEKAIEFIDLNRPSIALHTNIRIWQPRFILATWVHPMYDLLHDRR